MEFSKTNKLQEVSKKFFNTEVIHKEIDEEIIDEIAKINLKKIKLFSKNMHQIYRQTTETLFFWRIYYKFNEIMKNNKGSHNWIAEDVYKGTKKGNFERHSEELPL